MINNSYDKQVQLLLKVLPEVAKEKNLVLHGGTAINLFIKDMPRLSVDIDMIYTPIENRIETVNNINIALNNIQNNLEKILPNVKIQHLKEKGKLIISHRGSDIKLEVNLVKRGLFGEPKKIVLCEAAQNKYDVFVAMFVAPFGQLYGGKICAALDRQHPRDIFDIKLLLENEGISKETLTGFIFALISNPRPMYELLSPNLLDQRKVMETQFSGMTEDIFTYNDFELYREKLILQISNSLSSRDKQFLLSIKELNPDWSIYDFENFPAVQWKIQNLQKLKQNDVAKYNKQVNWLQEYLNK